MGEGAAEGDVEGATRRSGGRRHPPTAHEKLVHGLSLRATFHMALLLTILLLSGTALQERPYKDVSVEEAAAEARAEGKLLLIDFTSSWWRKDRKTEKVVWPDEGVRAWIAEHAV